MNLGVIVVATAMCCDCLVWAVVFLHRFYSEKQVRSKFFILMKVFFNTKNTDGAEFYSASEKAL